VISHFNLVLLYFTFFSNIELPLYVCVCKNYDMGYKAQAIVNLRAASWAVNLCYFIQFIYSQIGFKRDSASPTTNFTVRHGIAVEQDAIASAIATALLMLYLHASDIPKHSTFNRSRAATVLWGTDFRSRPSTKLWRIYPYILACKLTLKLTKCYKLGDRLIRAWIWSHTNYLTWRNFSDHAITPILPFSRTYSHKNWDCSK